VQQDPLVSRAKLIAEPWDLGPGGYQVGNFPPQWTEWNGAYRDTVRDYWRGEPATLGEFAARLSGSSDLYQEDGRRPYASINFVTAHDGFTLRDLVSYNEKHNEANGEDNNDGESHNRSWNCGAEGETDDPQVLALRARQQRNMLTTLFLSQGVPMLLHGDELGRSQGGNNNAYCQDNEISWIDWENLDEGLLEFARTISRLRAEHPVFRRRRFPRGRMPWGNGPGELEWLRPDGSLMEDSDWEAGSAKSLAMFLNGDKISEPGPRGEKIIDDSFLLLFNAHHEDLPFRMPPAYFAAGWSRLVDTAERNSEENGVVLEPGAQVSVAARSLQVLIRSQGEG
jgi:isoamylase